MQCYVILRYGMFSLIWACETRRKARTAFWGIWVTQNRTTYVQTDWPITWHRGRQYPYDGMWLHTVDNALVPLPIRKGLLMRIVAPSSCHALSDSSVDRRSSYHGHIK